MLDAATQREKDAAMQAKANAQAAELLAKEKRKAKDAVEQANAAMREAKRLQAEANAKYAEAEAVLSRFGLADVPPQPTPPPKGRGGHSSGRVRAMSAYQSNVKVEPPCVARSARTPGSIVSSSTTFECGRCPSTPLVGVSAPVPLGTGSLLTRKGTMSSATSNRRLRVICWSRAQRLAAGLLTLISLGGSQ